MLVVECPPFTIDGNGKGRVKIHVCQLRNAAHFLHVRSIASSPKDAPNLGGVIGVGRGDQSPGGIIYQGSYFDRNTLKELKSVSKLSHYSK